MALMSLVSKEFKTKIGNLTFDGTLEETITAGYKVSDYPTENREVSVNNIARERRTLKLKFIVTDTPTPDTAKSAALSAAAFATSRLPPAVQGAIGMAAQLPIVPAFAEDKLYNGKKNIHRSALALQSILKEAERKEKFQVFTEKGLYDNMVITRVYSKNDPDAQRHVIIDIDMEESPEYEIESEEILNPKKMVDHSIEACQGASEVNMGRLA